MENIIKKTKKYQDQDIFAGKIPINLNKVESITSYEGMCLSFLFYIVMFFYIIFNSPGDIIWRRFPSVSQSNLNQHKTSNVDVASGDFFFFFNIFDKNNDVVDDDTHIYLKMRLNKITKKPVNYIHDGKNRTKNNFTSHYYHSEKVFYHTMPI